MTSIRRGHWVLAVLGGAVLACGLNACTEADRDSLSDERLQLEKYWKDRHALPPMAAGRFELLAKAQPDECFDQLGGPYQCAAGRTPNKVNQAYLWGLTATDDAVWFGTAANMMCFGMGGPSNPLGPHQTDAWECEYGTSRFLADFNAGYSDPADRLAANLGDWRPPQIWRRMIGSGAEENLSARIVAEADLYRLNHTFGLRSAGSMADLVFLAGPQTLLGPMADFGAAGINVFVFQTDGTFLGSQSFPQYNDIRRWLVVGDQLYAGVGNTAGGGAVLRFRGLIAASGETPFGIDFEEVVSTIDGGAADLAEHQGRLFVSTWPNMAPGALLPIPFGLWMSPPLQDCGLLESGQWQKVWQADRYEPDAVVAATYAGGALASFDGDLYFGTMHMPVVAAFAHFAIFGMPEPGNELEFVTTVLGTHRPAALFRGRDFGTPNQKVEVLYGERLLPVRNLLTRKWELRQNNLPDPEPLYGHSGFNNFFNTYVWSMAVHRDRLFVGTFDWSYPAVQQLKLVAERAIGTPLAEVPDLPVSFGFGADLFSLGAKDRAARAVSIGGVGNYANYGVRNLLAHDGVLYLGTANPMNLMTAPDDGKPEGGWELLRLE